MVIKHWSIRNEFRNMMEIPHMFNKVAMLSTLLHRGIPQLISCFEDEGQFYLVQEFIDGHTLDNEINSTNKWTEVRATDLKWTEVRVTDLLKEVLEILAYMHNQGYVYRDLKPSNIMRRHADQKLMLIDFKWMYDMQQTTTNMTTNFVSSSSIVIGTLGYLPPEQIGSISVWH